MANVPGLKVGDKILFGKYKNRSATITGFGTDDNNQPTLLTDKGELPVFHFRLQRLMDEEKTVKTAKDVLKLFEEASRDFAYRGSVINVADAQGKYRITVEPKGNAVSPEKLIVSSSAEGIIKAKKIIDGWIDDELITEAADPKRFSNHPKEFFSKMNDAEYKAYAKKAVADLEKDLSSSGSAAKMEIQKQLKHWRSEAQ